MKVPALHVACLMLLAAGACLAQGKAEPLRVKFAPGASSATLTGVLRGDEQYEYLVEANGGQWMDIELASKQPDAAALYVKTPAGEEAPAAYAWSYRLRTGGDYFIRVAKLPGYPATDFTLRVAITGKSPGLTIQGGDLQTRELRAAMRRFVHAVRKRDTRAFLSFFSRSRPFSALNPMNIGAKGEYRKAIPYARLAADLNARKGLYWTYLQRGENGAMDAFPDVMPGPQAWLLGKGNKFVPPGSGPAHPTFVRWRSENGRWVVAEISYGRA